MKPYFKIRLVLIGLMTVVLFACTTDDEIISPEIIRSQVMETVKSGTWRITNYNDSGKDETADYAGYDFSFHNDGTLSASKSGTTINGTWSVTEDSNDDGSRDIDFNISFSTPEVFAELTDDWDILSATDLKIELSDVSGGNGTTDLLTFEKN